MFFVLVYGTERNNNTKIISLLLAQQKKNVIVVLYNKNHTEPRKIIINYFSGVTLLASQQILVFSSDFYSPSTLLRYYIQNCSLKLLRKKKPSLTPAVGVNVNKYSRDHTHHADVREANFQQILSIQLLNTVFIYIKHNKKFVFEHYRYCQWYS